MLNFYEAAGKMYCYLFRLRDGAICFGINMHTCDIFHGLNKDRAKGFVVFIGAASQISTTVHIKS